MKREETDMTDNRAIQTEVTPENEIDMLKKRLEALQAETAERARLKEQEQRDAASKRAEDLRNNLFDRTIEQVLELVNDKLNLANITLRAEAVPDRRSIRFLEPDGTAAFNVWVEMADKSGWSPWHRPKNPIYKFTVGESVDRRTWPLRKDDTFNASAIAAHVILCVRAKLAVRDLTNQYLTNQVLVESWMTKNEVFSHFSATNSKDRPFHFVCDMKLTQNEADKILAALKSMRP
jgi:hypothetical protein